MNKLILCTTKDELLEHYLIRKAVFIDEQKISYEDEYDFQEKEALPYLFFYEGKAIGSARINIKEDYAKLERICILKPYRGLGLGKKLLEELMKRAQNKGINKFILGAQAYAVPFYEKLGFKVASEMYYDAGIPHYKMKKES